jgi:hypothetical protein
MVQDSLLGVRFPPEIKQALERASKDDMRSTASLIKKVLTEWLLEKCYLAEHAGQLPSRRPRVHPRTLKDR